MPKLCCVTSPLQVSVRDYDRVDDPVVRRIYSKIVHAVAIADGRDCYSLRCDPTQFKATELGDCTGELSIGGSE
jgi:hypothetical protein